MPISWWRWTTNEVSGALIQGVDHPIPFDSQTQSAWKLFGGQHLLVGNGILDWI